MPAPLESIPEQIAIHLRSRLAEISHEAAPGTWWYTPDRVARVDDYDAAHIDPALSTLYWIRPGDEFNRERATKTEDVDAELFLVALRKFPRPPKTAYLGQGPLVASRPLVDGALPVVALDHPGPADAYPVRLRATGSVTAGTVTVVGTDWSGAPLTVAFDLAKGLEQFSEFAFAAVASSAAAGVVAGPGATVELEYFLTRWTVQNRLVRDAKKKLLENVRVAGLTYNLEIPDVSRDLFAEGQFPWAPVELRILARHVGSVTAP